MDEFVSRCTKISIIKDKYEFKHSCLHQGRELPHVKIPLKNGFWTWGAFHLRKHCAHSPTVSNGTSYVPQPLANVGNFTRTYFWGVGEWFLKWRTSTVDWTVWIFRTTIMLDSSVELERKPLILFRTTSTQRKTSFTRLCLKKKKKEEKSLKFKTGDLLTNTSQVVSEIWGVIPGYTVVNCYIFHFISFYLPANMKNTNMY